VLFRSNSGIIRWPNLYLQDAHPVHTTTAMHNKNKRIIHASINGNSLSAFTPVYGRIKLFIYDLRGRQLFGWHGKGPDIYLKHITSLQRGTYIIHVSSISMSFKRTILVR